MNRRFTAYAIVFSLLGLSLSSQAQLSTNPSFPTENDSIVITYDASAGNGALTGYAPIYAHTGVITNLSSSQSDWRYVQGTWGTADSRLVMTPLGNNLHRIAFRIRDFYSVPAGETVLKLAFVFRNQSGSVVGRASDGSDIYLDLFGSGFSAKWDSPDKERALYNLNDSINLRISASQAATLRLSLNGNLLLSASGAVNLNQTYTFSATGDYTFTYSAQRGSTILYDTLHLYVQDQAPVQEPPAGLKLGLNRTGDSTAVFRFIAPYKSNAYLIGDFNDWQIGAASEMKKSSNDSVFWLEIKGLDPDRFYAYQVIFDDPLNPYADPFAFMVLDPWNDQYIAASTYPNMPAYPSGKAKGMASAFRLNYAPYTWQNDGYTKPEAQKLNVYELLIRDFHADHSFQSVIDSLDYLSKMGINAIELMPIMEFEGNISWGYNVSFFQALDKYYGSAESLKKLIDECHGRGIAVILDIAMNHSFGQSPLVQMYFNSGTGQVTPQSPWFNVTAKHDFNVGYDFNHESPATKEYARQVYQYWVDEFHIDGYRIDLSKGYTQKNTLGNLGAWNAYDPSRVSLLCAIRDAIKEKDPNSILILEHLSDNQEEMILADSGFLLWGNMNHEFSEATMGYSSNFNWMDYKNRSWSKPNVVAYMESHDEERLMFKNKQYGALNGSYNVKLEATGLQRNAAAALLFFTLPGPKMIWQFGELGFDYSINRCENGTINNDCRTSPKPIVWNYFQNADKRELYQVYSSILDLRNKSSIFHSLDYTHSLTGTVKYIDITEGNDALLSVANLGTANATFTYKLKQGGTYYEYFSGTSVDLSDSSLSITLAPGEYRLYSTQDFGRYPYKLAAPLSERQAITVYPNPAKNLVQVNGLTDQALSYALYDMQGKHLLSNETKPQGTLQIHLPHLSSGVYLLSIQQGNQVYRQRITIDN
ncbi:MAG: T9SS type A sorting domain-containing protein [Bacteroidetes bacterium]|nr:MAG: T9SS type A sorting domain-containing protein [Bacteroidota bacterium]